MKKLVLSALCVSLFLFSCASASDENMSETTKTSQTQARTSSITKTTEMINFESALKKYMQNKPYFDDAKLKEESEKDISLNATKLLVAIGTPESEIKENETNVNTLIPFALKKYSAFLNAAKN
jgi:guanyl-specific ribonuclease Sa